MAEVCSAGGGRQCHVVGTQVRQGQVGQGLQKEEAALKLDRAEEGSGRRTLRSTRKERLVGGRTILNADTTVGEVTALTSLEWKTMNHLHGVKPATLASHDDTLNRPSYLARASLEVLT